MIDKIRISCLLIMNLILTPTMFLSGFSATVVYKFGGNDRRCAVAAALAALLGLLFTIPAAIPSIKTMMRDGAEKAEKEVLPFELAFLLWMFVLMLFMTTGQYSARLQFILFLAWSVVSFASWFAFIAIGYVNRTGSFHDRLVKCVPALNVVGVPGVVAARYFFPELGDKLPSSPWLDSAVRFAATYVRTINRWMSGEKRGGP